MKRWIQYPFSPRSLDLIPDDATDLKEELINLRNDFSKEEFFSKNQLPTFWLSQKDEYPLLTKEALQCILAFPTSWECEAAFSQISVIKTKHRNRLSVESDARVALSETEPDIEKLVASKQCHVSH